MRRSAGPASIDARSMSRSSAARHGDGAAPVPWASAARASRIRWPWGTGWARRCARHGAHTGSLASRRRGTSARSQRTVKATTSPRGLRATRNAPRTASHQARMSATSSAGSWRAVMASIAGPSLGAGQLDRVVLDRGGEERLAHERLVDQRDHVRERRPARGPGGGLDLARGSGATRRGGGRGGAPDRSHAAAPRRPRGRCRGRPGPRGPARRRAAPRGGRRRRAAGPR